MCRSRVVGRARTIGNRVYPIRVSRVRISPSAPNPETVGFPEVSGFFHIHKQEVQRDGAWPLCPHAERTDAFGQCVLGPAGLAVGKEYGRRGTAANRGSGHRALHSAAYRPAERRSELARAALGPRAALSEQSDRAVCGHSGGSAAVRAGIPLLVQPCRYRARGQRPARFRRTYDLSRHLPNTERS